MSHALSHHSISPSTTGVDTFAVSAPSGTFSLPGAYVAFGPQASPTPGPNGKKRKLSKMKSGKQVSESLPTQLRSSSMSDSDADKKRNKLGYQRISIACGHCRRRKIRCLVVEGDLQQRCQNCIHLKKECVFYPIDQQAIMESHSKLQPAVKTGVSSGPSPAVPASPTDLSVGRPFDPSRDYHAFPSLPSNAPPIYQGLPLEPTGALPRGNLSSSNIDYRPRDGMRSQYATSSDFDPPVHSTIANNIGDTQSSYWRFSPPSGIVGDFAPFPSGPASTIQTSPDARAYSFAHPGEQGSWQPTQQPVQSMSYGNIEALPGRYPPENMGYQPDLPHYQQPMHYQTPTLDVQSACSMAPGSGLHSAPGDAQPLPQYGQPNPHMYHQPDQSSTTNTSLPSNAALSEPWYSEQSTLGQFEEERAQIGQGRYSNRPR